MARSDQQQGVSQLVEQLRRRIANAASAPFGHAPYPLARTLDYPGDTGLLGPESVSWRVIADPATFVGGIRALLIQAAHPEVVAGVGDHSRYREDPLGRLSRTSNWVTATTYGALPEVEAAVTQVRRAHRVVSGISGRGVAYSADDPGLAAWVHNALTDSFLAAHRAYGGIGLSTAEADAFVEEQRQVGALLDSDPMPRTARALAGWIADHPGLAPSVEMADAVAFLSDPPLEQGLRLGYRILLEAAVATIPPRIRRVLGLTRVRLGVPLGRSAVAGLRWALGYSPSWRLALIRTGREIPEHLFKQPPRAA